MYRFDKADNEQARHFFEMALRLDPTFARAYAGLSFTHLQNAFQGWAERNVDRVDGSDHMDGPDGPALFRHACRMGLEGIVSKRRDRAYRAGRCAHWLKIKNPTYERPSGAASLEVKRFS